MSNRKHRFNHKSDYPFLNDFTFGGGSGGSGGGSGNTYTPPTLSAKPTATDDSSKKFYKDSVAPYDGKEYICLDDTVNNAVWAELLADDTQLANMAYDGYKVFIQSKEALYKYDSNQWFPDDQTLANFGLIKTDEVWNRVYDKIPQGYSQIVCGLEINSNDTLQVDGELIDLKAI